ncbi:MAG: metalloregulator ArsR/SmtB family transcription factor [Polyangiaceae bacterium]
MTETKWDPACDTGTHSHAAKPPTPYSEAAFERAAALFRAAGDVPRLKLLELLSRGEMCVTEIAESLGEGLSTISQRLRLLRSEGLLRRHREGKHIYYALADEHVSRMLHDALVHAGEPHDRD